MGIKNQGWHLDWTRFRRYLRDKYAVTKAFLCIGFIEKNADLYASLQEAGFILIFKPTLEITIDDAVVTKGNVDAELVLHTMIEYPNYDQAVIISGDGDFYCLVKYLQENKKLHRLIVPNFYRYSRLLREFAGQTTYLNKLQSKIGKRKTH